jgi:alkylhydroperoxidase family enzyme
MDPLARPTATPGRLLRWLVELADATPGLVEAWGPWPRALSTRTREQILVAVADINGSRHAAWVHGAWRDFLGDADPDHSLAAVLDFTWESARGGRPASTEELSGHLPTNAVRAVRATIAVAELGTLAANSSDSLLTRFRKPRRLLRPSALNEAIVTAAAAPFAIPALVGATLMRSVNRIAPPLPRVEAPPTHEANLVVHLLADLVPRRLATSAARLFLLGLPVPISFGVRVEGTEATVRLSRSRVVLENGLRPDTLLVVDGGIQLLDTASRALNRELAALMTRRPT